MPADSESEGPPLPAGIAPPSNVELARVFHEIGDLLEVKGELIFKTVAYHRAADTIGHAPVGVAQAYLDGQPPDLPGIGRAIADKVAELARTGRLRYHDDLVAEFPATLLDLLGVPGLGPRTVRLLWTTLGIADLDALRSAALDGRLRGLRGISSKTEAAILEGIDGIRSKDHRLLLSQARDAIRLVADALIGVEGVVRVVPAGSFRRRRETIGDLDLLVETTDAGPAIRRFTTLPQVEAVLIQGAEKASSRLAGGPRIDLMRMTPGAAGSYLVHFTGSKAHNVRLRERARDQGWSLSEKGFTRLADDGTIPAGDAGEVATFETEEEVYAFLGLPFIAPELREDSGEIEAAIEGRLPRLLELSDLRGDLHSHSDWSDGTQPIEVMATAARLRGHAYQVLTDHSVSLAIARGLTPQRVAQQARLIEALNRTFAADEDGGRSPAETPPEGFRLLHGCELEIRADGRLDYDDELLARFDVVVASLHVGRRQSRAELTSRVLTAIRNPHVDVIAHPSGRKIGVRDDLDLDWDAVYTEAARTGTILEMNGSPPRLDLAVERARRAVAMGCLLAVDSDAHRIEEFEHLEWGVGQARRAWVGPDSVVNTRSRADLLAYVRRDDPRVPRS